MTLLLLGAHTCCFGAQGGDPNLRKNCVSALRKAVTFYRAKVARHGGYVYHYSLDLKRRWGEGEASPDQIWVQPPGTPTVGMAFLEAFHATGDKVHLEAAQEAAKALLYGQVKSGGWTYCVDFNPLGKRVAMYRNGKGGGKNYSVLDDNTTQAALCFLMRMDKALSFKNEEIHDAVQIALDALLKAQFPNGAFPQVWKAPVERHPVLKATYPEYDWRTEGRIKNYWDLYTLNDNLAGDVAQVFIEAQEIYKDKKYRAALERLGNFLILAQMPNPQPAWAQQYNYKLQPVWARKFEPPAITGGESHDVMRALMKIYRATGDARYLAPIPKALKYLKSSLLPDGKLARYYELKTNKPLYMKRRGKVYTLTYDDSDLPKHYAFKISSGLKSIEREYDRLKRDGPRPTKRPSIAKLAEDVRRIIKELDDKDRWVSTCTGKRLSGQPKLEVGSKYISSKVFSRNVEALSAYLSATR